MRYRGFINVRQRLSRFLLQFLIFGNREFDRPRLRVGFPFPSIFLINKFAGPSTREFLTANGRE